MRCSGRNASSAPRAISKKAARSPSSPRRRSRTARAWTTRSTKRKRARATTKSISIARSPRSASIPPSTSTARARVAKSCSPIRTSCRRCGSCGSCCTPWTNSRPWSSCSISSWPPRPIPTSSTRRSADARGDGVRLLRRRQRDLHRLHPPDLVRVLAYGAVGREFPHVRHVEYRLAVPLLAIGIKLRHPLLGRDIRGVIRQQQIMIAAVREAIDDGAVQFRITRRKVAARDHVERLTYFVILVIVVPGVVTPRTRLRHLLRGEAEDVDVVLAHLLTNLDIRAIEGADGERADKREFHIAGARGLGTGGGDLLGEIAGRDDHLRERYAVIGQKNHLELIADGGVVVDDIRDVVDELDDALGHRVTGRRLAGEDHRARHARRTAALTDAVVQGDD